MEPKDKIRRWMLAQFEQTAWLVIGMTIGDTPIENAFIVAVEAWLWARGLPLVMRRCGGEWGSPQKQLEDPKTWFVFEPQAQIDAYRVDFAFYQRGGEESKIRGLVVECDGHDFHERTKQQAITDRSRDRRLQELGYTVYRFTGSEIYSDPMKCAEQLLQWVDEP